MSRDREFRIAVRKYGPFESAIRKQWDRFESENRTGFVLKTEAFDLDDLTATLFDKKGLERGQWDVAFINTDWIAAVHRSGCVVDLGPLLESAPPEEFPDGWAPSLLRLQNVNGFVAGVPYHDGPECMIFRKDLFEEPSEQRAYEAQFGTALRPPKTWQEFRQVATFFQRPEAGLYGTVFAAYPDGHNTVYDFLLQLWSRGGRMFERTGEIQFKSDTACAGLEFYRSMLRDNAAIHPDSRAMDSVKSGLAFAAGEVATMVNWFGFATMCETVADSKVKGCVDIAHVPYEEPGGPTSLNVYWLLAIGSGSPHRDLAYEFLRHCMKPEMDKLLTLEGAIGCRTSTWLNPEVNRLIPFYNQLPHLHENARELPRSPEWPRIAKLIDEVVIETIQTDRPIASILTNVQAKAEGLSFL
jgi:multiple sugar transport system substrate-binding protein